MLILLLNCVFIIPNFLWLKFQSLFEFEVIVILNRLLLFDLHIRSFYPQQKALCLYQNHSLDHSKHLTNCQVKLGDQNYQVFVKFHFNIT